MTDPKAIPAGTGDEPVDFSSLMDEYHRGVSVRPSHVTMCEHGVYYTGMCRKCPAYEVVDSARPQADGLRKLIEDYKARKDKVIAACMRDGDTKSLGMAIGAREACDTFLLALSAPASEGREVDTRLTKWFGDKGGGRIICGDKVLGRALTSEKIAEAHNSAIDVALRRISYLQRKCERAGASVRVETSEASASTPAATEPTEYRYVQIGKEIAEELHFSWKRSMLRDLGRCAWKAVARQLSQRGRG